jgi:hypothetical protein
MSNYKPYKLPKKTRQNNTSVTVCGIKFDSKWEADRYLQLLYLQEQGIIRDLQLQKKFELIPAVREPDTIGKRGGVKQGKVIERAVYYVADFVDVKDGENVVEDAKGYYDTSSAMYKVFIIKRKLMLWRYGLQVREVRRENR